MSLGQIVRFLILLLDRGNIDLCFRERARWHALFYQLKFSLTPETPSVLQSIFFEWDGPSPVCRELDVYLNDFCWTGCVECYSPSFSDHQLSKGVAAIWAREYSRLTEEQKKFLEEVALKKAQEEFTRTAAV